MPKELKRTLYDCFNAKVKGNTIYCAKGYSLGKKPTGMIETTRLARGAPLVYVVCQNCPDYSEIGPPIPREERGWLKKKVVK